MAKKKVRATPKYDAFQHPAATSPMRPEVGTQAQFKKKKPPVTYRYDSSLSPALVKRIALRDLAKVPLERRGEDHLKLGESDPIPVESASALSTISINSRLAPPVNPSQASTMKARSGSSARDVGRAWARDS